MKNKTLLEQWGGGHRVEQQWAENKKTSRESCAESRQRGGNDEGVPTSLRESGESSVVVVVVVVEPLAAAP